MRLFTTGTVVTVPNRSSNGTVSYRHRVVAGFSNNELSSPDVAQVTLSVNPLVPHTMLSSEAAVPQTMLSSLARVPQTTFGQFLPEQSVPHTMLSSLDALVLI